MIKTYKILFLSLFLINISFCQSKKHVNDMLFLDLNVGPSIPLGDFSSKDANSNTSGYAIVGVKAQLGLGINFYKSLGFYISAFTDFNGTNPDNLTAKANNLYPGNNFSASSNSWNLYGGMVGLTYGIDTHKGILIDLKFTGGYLSAKSPEFSFTSSNGNFYKIDSKSASSYTYCLSVGSRYYIIKNELAITLAVEYMGSKPEFNNVNTTSSINGQVTQNTVTFNRAIDALNIVTGVRYSIF